MNEATLARRAVASQKIKVWHNYRWTFWNDL